MIPWLGGSFGGGRLPEGLQEGGENFANLGIWWSEQIGQESIGEEESQERRLLLISQRHVASWHPYRLITAVSKRH